MAYKVVVKNIKFNDWEGDGKPPSELTLTLPNRASENAMYEISCILDAIEDETGCRPNGYLPVSGVFH